MTPTHTFAICAYGKSPYLRDCIESIKAQTYRESEVYLSTATPSAWLSHLAEEYDLPIYVNEGAHGIGEDWNFAYSKATGAFVTIAHQDDVYEAEYAATAVRMLEASRLPLIFFTNYGELRDGVPVDDNRLLRIKRRLLKPFLDPRAFGSVKARRRMLRMGSAICCPSVTLCRRNVPNPPFVTGMRSNLDWATWERLSRLPGEFIYAPQILMRHRIHGGSTTSKLIADRTRGAEDLEMLERFWPKPVARLIYVVYSHGMDSNVGG